MKVSVLFICGSGCDLTDSRAAHGVLYFKYASILLQALTVEIDEDLLYTLLDFAKFRGLDDADNVTSVLTEEGHDLPEAPQSVPSTEVYFESLELQPVQLDISFQRTERLSEEAEYVSSVIVSFAS